MKIERQAEIKTWRRFGAENSRISKLIVAENGNNLLIERALAVGEVPLKVIADEHQAAEASAAKCGAA